MSYRFRNVHSGSYRPRSRMQDTALGVQYDPVEGQRHEAPTARTEVTSHSCEPVTAHGNLSGNGLRSYEVSHRLSSLSTQLGSTASAEPFQRLRSPGRVYDSDTLSRYTAVDRPQTSCPLRATDTVRVQAPQASQAHIANLRWPDGVARLHVDIWINQHWEQHMFAWPLDEHGNRRPLDLEQMYELAEVMRRMPVRGFQPRPS